MHSINCTLHRTWHCSRNDLNRHPAHILHGGQRTCLSPLCETEQEPSPPDSSLPSAAHLNLHWLLTIMEARRELLVGPALLWRSLDRHHGLLSPQSPLPPQTIRVVCAIDAMASCGVSFPQCVPHDHTEGEVFHEVCSVEQCDHSVLFVVRGSFNLSRGRDGVVSGDGRESWKPKPICSAEQNWSADSLVLHRSLGPCCLIQGVGSSFLPFFELLLLSLTPIIIIRSLNCGQYNPQRVWESKLLSLLFCAEEVSLDWLLAFGECAGGLWCHQFCFLNQLVIFNPKS